MEIVKMFVAKDDLEFDNQHDCEEYERLIQEVDDAMSCISRKVYLNSGRYIQWTLEKCNLAKKNLLCIIRRLHARDFPNVFSHDDEKIHPLGVLGRIMDDMHHGDCIGRAWRRMGNIDWKTGREYDRAYFVLHPEETATFEEVNPIDQVDNR